MITSTSSSAEPSSTMGKDSPSTPGTDQGGVSSSSPVARNMQSHGSSDAGESSTAASQRNSLLSEGGGNGTNISGTTADLRGRDGRGSHRSHRSRHSGGFLLSNSTFERPADTLSTPKSSPPQRRPLSDYKGKSASKSPEKKQKPRNLNHGFGLGSSPLAGHVSSVQAEAEAPVSKNLDGDAANDQAVEPDNSSEAKSTSAALEVDAAQIVNLALNLSESRRNASRRIASGALPPPLTTFTDNIAGSSMRYHMQQQQRRSSRNVSPKPDRGEKAMGPTSRLASGRLSTQLQPVFDLQPDGTYQYQFSASTIARADKAKKAIELMAQYRKLLDYVAPLKPATLERTVTIGIVAGSPTSSSGPQAFRTYSRNDNSQLGRPYNPLQYIRNRKVRARNSMAIDGEEQGFGDLDNVSSWVEEISRTSSPPTGADCLSFPPFSKAGESASLQDSPQSTLGRSNTSVKIRRPRIDWTTNPADMLADVFWLEQNDNKKLVEDRHGRTIFPRDVELRKPTSRWEKEPVIPAPNLEGDRDEDAGQAAGGKLPEFKSVKADHEKFPDLGQSRARQKLREVRDATRIHHGHNGHSRDIRGFLRARSRSDSNSSNSETDHHSTRRRSGTVDSDDQGKDILEKQMEVMLAEESRDLAGASANQVEEEQKANHAESRDAHLHEELERLNKGPANHNRSASLANRSNRDSYRNGSSGRASLEVPGSSPRGSLEDLDHTAPNSPERKATRTSNSHIPSIAMDLSSPRRRHSSQLPGVVSKAEAEVRLDHDRRQDSDRSKDADDNESMLTESISKDTTSETPETLKKLHRSLSPGKKMIQRKTDDSVKSVKKGGSIRRGRAEDSSGIRGFLKSARNPVSRVGDMLWKKEPLPGHGNASSSMSTDDSDSEARVPPSKTEEEQKRDSTGSVKFDDLDKAWPRKERPSYLNEMPVFTSPFDTRGRQIENRRDEASALQPHSIDAQTARETRRLSARARLLDPAPRIDVYPPFPSPDLGPLDGNRRQSSISVQESRKGSFPDGVQEADSRLNAVLGYPGKRRNDGLPVTGLAGLEPSNDRRPSLRDKRQWSISDRAISAHRGPTTKRETARVQALLLSSGIKAKEISRRAAELKDLREEQQRSYVDIAELSQDELAPVPKSQEHLLAARIVSNDIQLSSQMWQDSADSFCNTTVSDLLSSIDTLQSRLSEHLTPMTRKAADEADEFSKDLVTSQTLKVQQINDKMEKMFRARRRRFRWLRRGGWVLVEWALVGVMWYVWFMVMVLRIVMGIGSGVVGSVRWLFFA